MHAIEAKTEDAIEMKAEVLAPINAIYLGTEVDRDAVRGPELQSGGQQHYFTTERLNSPGCKPRSRAETLKILADYQAGMAAIDEKYHLRQIRDVELQLRGCRFVPDQVLNVVYRKARTSMRKTGSYVMRNGKLMKSISSEIIMAGPSVMNYSSSANSDSGISEKLRQAEAARWYLDFKHLSSSKKYSEALDLLFSQVEDAFDVSDLHKIDCMLRLINPTDLPSEMLVSVLRATSRAKESLTSWQYLFQFAQKQIQEGLLPSRVLRGL